MHSDAAPCGSFIGAAPFASTVRLRPAPARRRVRAERARHRVCATGAAAVCAARRLRRRAARWTRRLQRRSGRRGGDRLEREVIATRANTDAATATARHYQPRGTLRRTDPSQSGPSVRRPPGREVGGVGSGRQRWGSGSCARSWAVARCGGTAGRSSSTRSASSPRSLPCARSTTRAAVPRGGRRRGQPAGELGAPGQSAAAEYARRAHARQLGRRGEETPGSRERAPLLRDGARAMRAGSDIRSPHRSRSDRATAAGEGDVGMTRPSGKDPERASTATASAREAGHAIGALTFTWPTGRPGPRTRRRWHRPRARDAEVEAFTNRRWSRRHCSARVAVDHAQRVDRR